MSSIIQLPLLGDLQNETSAVLWNIRNLKKEYLKVTSSFLKHFASTQIKDTVYFWGGDWVAKDYVTQIQVTGLTFRNLFMSLIIDCPPEQLLVPLFFGNQFNYCVCKQS